LGIKDFNGTQINTDEHRFSIPQRRKDEGFNGTRMNTEVAEILKKELYNIGKMGKNQKIKTHDSIIPSFHYSNIYLLCVICVICG
jgi:uncharacterized protein YutD